jgi:hypothetical protein
MKYIFISYIFSMINIVQPVRSAYQPPTGSIFLSEQTSQQQPASSTFPSHRISTSHQPPAKRTDWLFFIIKLVKLQTV